MLAIVPPYAPAAQRPWESCTGSSVSFEFVVRAGMSGEVRVLSIPDGACMCVDEIYLTCCDSVKEYLPVVMECGCCALCVDCPGTFELPAGKYVFKLSGADGEPLVPNPHDIRVVVNQKVCS